MTVQRSRLSFLVTFAISVLFILSAQSFAQATSSSNAAETLPFVDKPFLQNVVLAVLSAVLAFISGYALAGIGRKRRKGKRLSYSLSVEEGLVKVEKGVKQEVQILYRGEPIENLYNIAFEMENTGDSVVKSHEVRFQFPEQTRVLDFFFEPKPQPEMGAEKVEAGPRLKNHERKLIAGHIEREQTLRAQFTVTSSSKISDDSIRIFPFNEAGDVEFISRSVTKEKSDKELVSQFVGLSILYLVIPPILTAVPGFVPSAIMSGLVRLLILLMLAGRIVPFSELIADVLVRLASEVSKSSQINIGGNVSSSSLLAGDTNRVHQKVNTPPLAP